MPQRRVKADGWAVMVTFASKVVGKFGPFDNRSDAEDLVNTLATTPNVTHAVLVQLVSDDEGDEDVEEAR